jgi:eukaryotic-like serine/threonine-protein kinase
MNADAVNIERLTRALADRYAIERELGQGGMATVYLAEDLKHHRKVAIKVLHAELSAILGPERFLKEIELTANLQHPHILPLFDSGSADGLLFYVMPFVEGETLRGRLDRDKQLPIADAIRIATEAADALEYAHGRGIVHRDIKPENILLQGGHCLVADFGIALAVQQAGGHRMTQTGLSLGTPQYMSPEQAMGERDIGPRSDIYSLGAVTYEMLSGDPPFTGSTAQAIVAQVITTEPRSLGAQRRSVPQYVDDAVMTALEKLPADRFASAAEFATAMGGAGGAPPRTAGRRALEASRSPRFAARFGTLPWILTSALLAVLLIASVASRLISRTQPSASVQSSFLPPPGCAFVDLSGGNVIQLTSDGTALAFTAICNGENALWVRTIGTGRMRQLAGTTDAIYYFWSPDGRSLGFFAGGQLKRIDVESGAVRDLAPAANGRGGSWGSDGTIVFAPDVSGPLYQVAADGGTAKPATKPVITAGSGVIITDRNPYFLPDGHHFLYSEGNGASWGGVERVAELGDMTSRQLLDVPSNVTYADGQLLYTRGGLLMAQPFDAARVELSGRPAAVVPELETNEFRVDGNFTASTAGMLVFRGLAPVDADIDLFDPKTNATHVLASHTTVVSARISPDGQYVLANRQAESGQERALSLYRVDGGMWTQLLKGVAADYGGVWSHDGRTVASVGPGERTIVITPVDGSQASQLRLTHGSAHFLNDWSPDGKHIFADLQSAVAGWDIERLDIAGNLVTPTPIIATPSDEEAERITPDGRLIAYARSTAGAGLRLYLARLPSGQPSLQVSESLWSGGTVGMSAWSPDGRTLYFIAASGKLMSASIDDGPELHAGLPKPVAGVPGNLTSVDVAADGRLLLVAASPAGPAPLTLVQNWTQLARNQ